MLSEFDFLSELLNEDLCDIQFEFDNDQQSGLENRENAATPKKFKAHKLLLSYVSPVLRRQFNGQIPSGGKVEKDIEVVKIEEFSHQAFSSCIKYAYGDKDVVAGCTDLALLFEMLLVSKKYMMDKLTNFIRQTIFKTKISRKNLFDILSAIEGWKEMAGFEDICSFLTKMCIKETKKDLKSAEDVYEFWTNNRDNELLCSFLDQLTATRGISCINCKAEDCLDGETVLLAEPPVGLKVKLSGSTDARKFGVIQTVETNRTDIWGGMMNKVKVKFGIDKEQTIQYSSVNFSPLSYLCNASAHMHNQVESEVDCKNCNNEECLDEQVFLSDNPIVGTKVRVTGTTRIGKIFTSTKTSSLDAWGSNIFTIDCSFPNGKSGDFDHSKNFSPLSFACNTD